MSEILFTGISPDQFADQVASRVSQILEREQRQFDSPLLTDRETTASLLNLSTSTLDKLVSRGVVPSITVGTKRLFDAAEVAAALKADSKATIARTEPSARSRT